MTKKVKKIDSKLWRLRDKDEEEEGVKFSWR